MDILPNFRCLESHAFVSQLTVIAQNSMMSLLSIAHNIMFMEILDPVINFIHNYIPLLRPFFMISS